MNLNKVILIGRVSSDVRYSKTNSGISFARTRIAISRSYTSDNEVTDFIPVIAWRSTADFLNGYAPKGTLVAIEGTLVTSTYESNGQTNYSVEVRIDNLHLLESRSVRNQRQTNEFSVVQPNFKKTDSNTTNSFAKSNKAFANNFNLENTEKNNNIQQKASVEKEVSKPEEQPFNNINFNFDDDFDE
ncbi:single-stranded DNA-binding protein [Mycoplasma bovis]|nr:single-stranded DNA-binding protein [Mycoplasmopsis bovis]MBT1346795.1 single-stranded DNA-binding protein [Mycoplasmopsis bovis]MBT1347555.1 single-stranded DNA-binding protein [Mycoplasmopsis bovis]MBT1348870.1 single-stranded DNA-binding protein [Mycoplasmopsis bovis]MBT1352095.1 single-stranded DNA-binding protein [Mycoplasmopsis bovis]